MIDNELMNVALKIFSKKCIKIFGGKRKGCIFASAFRGKGVMEKRGEVLREVKKFFDRLGRQEAHITRVI